MTAAIDAAPGRSGSTLVNLGLSGWDSTAMVEGQLPQAVVEAAAAVAEGRVVVTTVLIGSNDMWYLYDSDLDEDAVAGAYRSNLDRTVGELTQAGAVVVVGLPDDQSRRPLSRDLDALQAYFPGFTAEEVEQMSVMSQRLSDIAAEVADEHGARTVDTNSPFWEDTATMDPDLGHPNGAGYAVLADLFLAEIEDLL